MLLKNLENYIGKEKYKSVIDGMGDHFNFKIEENLTFSYG